MTVGVAYSDRQGRLSGADGSVPKFPKGSACGIRHAWGDRGPWCMQRVTIIRDVERQIDVETLRVGAS